MSTAKVGGCFTRCHLPTYFEIKEIVMATRQGRQKGLGKEYTKIKDGKLKTGSGGWYCACCNPYDMHPRKMKPLARRRLRRVEKMRLTKDVE